MKNEAASSTRAQRAISSFGWIITHPSSPRPTSSPFSAPPPPPPSFKLIELISRFFQDMIFTLLNSLEGEPLG